MPVSSMDINCTVLSVTVLSVNEAMDRPISPRLSGAVPKGEASLLTATTLGGASRETAIPRAE